jgi:shikimate dehydrogenase
MTKTINKHPKIAVIGWPISHSLSPVIHQFWLSKYDRAGEYDALALEKGNAEAFFLDFSNSDLQGANVTLPYKQLAYQACDQPDKIAMTLKAVNTLWLEGQTLHGTNTDSYGFLANLDQKLKNWDHHKKTALIIGAGGASRAILYGLIQRHYETILIANRSLDKAKALIDEFSSTIDFTTNIKAIAIETIKDELNAVDCLINTTSLGMTGQPELAIDLSPLPDHAIVTDIVYNPLMTDLLRKAQKRNLRICDGLGMLLHQAVPGFKKWFGQMPEVTSDLRDHVLSHLH